MLEDMSTEKKHADGIIAGRLEGDELAENFADIHPPLTQMQAVLEAERCYYCYDAPCIDACPTGIDIPSFIQRISTGDLSASAKKIFEQNIFGGMCARVCPTETLCEEACVRNLSEEAPVKIGLLQRHATDHALERSEQYFSRSPDNNRKVAVVGAGPAGLSCAHRLAMNGYKVQVFDARSKPGGLNEYGIAAYKTVDNFAQREVEYVLGIGGIEISYGQELGSAVLLSELCDKYDAVFLGIGLGAVRTMEAQGEQLEGVCSAVSFIEQIRQAAEPAQLAVGRRVVVVGGGMTAVDAASQSLRLGAEDVNLVYRRGPAQAPASAKEIRFVQNTGTKVRYWAIPQRILGDKQVTGVEFEYTALANGKLVRTGDTYQLPADMVLTAVGQKLVQLDGGAEILEITEGKLAVNDERQTSVQGIWAGGDCVTLGNDLTVSAVEDGKLAAASIDRHFRNSN